MRTLICLTVLALLAGCTSPPEQPDASAPLAACGMLPNCVRSETGGEGDAVAPLSASQSQWRALKRWLSEQRDWQIIDARGNYLHAIAITPEMRFTDDVQFLYEPAQAQIQVRSSSRLGISDMGANRERIEALRSQLSTLE